MHVAGGFHEDGALFWRGKDEFCNILSTKLFSEFCSTLFPYELW
jgi:hypothetical protein